MRGWLQRSKLLVFTSAVLGSLLVRPPGVLGQAAPIFLDGFFPDWTGTVEHTDPAGDAGISGVDFRDVDLANDNDNLFIRFQLTVPVTLQETNNLELYLDTDLNAATGLAVGGIGADLRWQFGARTGRFYAGGTNVAVFQDDIRLRQLPSVTSPEFEISIGRNVRPDGTNLLFTGNSMRVLLRDVGTNGDYAPNNGTTLMYSFDPTSVPAPATIGLTRAAPTDVRVVTWNVVHLDDFPVSQSAAADRVFSALDPDIVSLQELYNATAATVASRFETYLPSGPGEGWQAAKQNDCIVVTRFSIVSQWGLDGNLAVLLDADAVLGHDILLVSAHLPCCTNNSGRQAEADHIMQFFRDAMTAGGIVDVPNGTIFMITGDLNLVGDSQQLVTLLTGDIVNNATYGADFAPDWDGTGLGDDVSSQTERRFAYTWRSDTSGYAPGRLDFLIYSNSLLAVENNFSLYSPEMSAGQLSLYGILAGDVTTVSDHLPHIADFRQPRTSDTGDMAGRSGGMQITAVGSPTPGAVRFAVDLEQPARLRVQIFDVRGALVATLRDDDAGVAAAGAHSFVWDGGRAAGRQAASGAYFVRAVASPVVPGATLQAATRKVLLMH